MFSHVNRFCYHLELAILSAGMRNTSARNIVRINSPALWKKRGK